MFIDDDGIDTNDATDDTTAIESSGEWNEQCSLVCMSTIHNKIMRFTRATMKYSTTTGTIEFTSSEPPQCNILLQSSEIISVHKVHLYFNEGECPYTFMLTTNKSQRIFYVTQPPQFKKRKLFLSHIITSSKLQLHAARVSIDMRESASSTENIQKAESSLSPTFTNKQLLATLPNQLSLSSVSSAPSPLSTGLAKSLLALSNTNKNSNCSCPKNVNVCECGASSSSSLSVPSADAINFLTAQERQEIHYINEFKTNIKQYEFCPEMDSNNVIFFRTLSLHVLDKHQNFRQVCPVHYLLNHTVFNY